MRAHPCICGGGMMLLGLLSQAGGTYWPLATYPCPFFESFPSVGSSSHWPLTPRALDSPVWYILAFMELALLKPMLDTLYCLCMLCANTPLSPQQSAIKVRGSQLL